MRIANVTARDKAGIIHTWSTDITGTDEGIKQYFMNHWFDVGVYPQENMAVVISVDITDSES